MGVRSPDRLLATSVVMAVFAPPPVAQKQIQQPRLGCALAKVWRWRDLLAMRAAGLGGGGLAANAAISSNTFLKHDSR